MNEQTLNEKPDVQVPLSFLGNCYTGYPFTMNVHPYDPDIHEKPGVYLEFQEGCGYTPYDLTPDEARQVAQALIAAADWADKQTWGNPKYG